MNKERDLIVKQFKTFHDLSKELSLSIVKQKIRNQHYVLNHFLKKQKDQSVQREIINQISNVLELAQVENQELFLFEAQAASSYWKEINNILSKYGDSIRRSSKRRIGANKLLDIGYHYLLTEVKTSIESHRLWPEIGFFHKYRSGNKPFAYDVMELFRQPIVDKTVVQLYRQSKRPIVVNQYMIKKLIYNLKRRWLKEQMDNILDDEINKFVRLIKYNEPYEPFIWKWGHKNKKL
jgi:CRISPR-associated protein Cas1